VIEAEKLRAIGFRGLAEYEKSTRPRRQRELQALIEEQHEELARLTAELESLTRVEAEQKEALEKLTNNEAV
jgi:vacuolar-type H+-ATPase subunit I/STV1